MTTRTMAAVLFCGVLLTGCTTIGEIRQALSTYEEPNRDPRARIRLISDRAAPFIYPARACVDPGAAGAGAARDPDSGAQIDNGLGYRTIGIPAVPVAGGRAITEIYARAGEPITFTLAAGGCGSNWCPVDKIEKEICVQSRSFTPDANTDYVATIRRQGAACDIELYRVVERGSDHAVVPEDSAVASECTQSNG